MNTETLLFNLQEKQNFTPLMENKTLYGEVNTPYTLIQDMLALFPKELFQNPHIKWLDPACGCGYFPVVVYNILMHSLKDVITCREKRKTHIIQNMLYMCEIQNDNIHQLKKLFGEDANILHLDFLSSSVSDFGIEDKFDIIIGNPPYNSNGLKKVPTNSALNKKQDGITLWHSFIKHSMTMLKNGGFLNMIVPSIWMKPDKANMYSYMTQYKLHKIRCFTNTETKQMFKGQAQTPTCYFLLEKRKSDKSILLYDGIDNAYKKFALHKNIPIPLIGVSIVQKLLSYVDKYGILNVNKTNLPKKGVQLSEIQTEKYPYANIKTCKLNGLQPYIVKQYSNTPCAFYGEKKIILSHKMYGFPCIDKEGTYGISNRDNYVMIGYTNEEMNILNAFLQCKCILFLFETTRYRMKYLEKYVFEYIPNILKIHNFPKNITDDTVNTYFNFSLNEIQYMMKYHKNYNSIVEM